MATARSGEMATSRPSMCERKTACSLGDLDAMGEAEELEAAAVGQDRAVPAHEAVQAAQRRDHLFAGPQGQVIGVAQDHLGPGGAELLDLQPLDAALRATGMKAGISTGPCGVVERAPPRGTARVGVVERKRERCGHRLASDVGPARRAGPYGSGSTRRLYCTPP